MTYDKHSEQPFVVVWEVTCFKTDSGEPAKFPVVDTDGDPNFCCDICGSCRSHLPATTDTATRVCPVCEGAGKHGNNRCYLCKGKGTLEHTHIKRLVGRIYTDELMGLAAKNPKGWYMP